MHRVTQLVAKLEFCDIYLIPRPVPFWLTIQDFEKLIWVAAASLWQNLGRWHMMGVPKEFREGISKN